MTQIAHWKNLSIEDIKGEKWKYIPDTGKYYKASNKGRIKSVDRVINRRRQGSLYIKGQIISQFIANTGYLMLNMSLSNKRVIATVHRIIAKVFIPNPENKAEVNHKKAIKFDNRASQLEWINRPEHDEHTNGNFLRSKGENHYKSKLKEKDVLFIIKSPLKEKEISAMFSISSGTISLIRSRKIWRHLKV